MSAVQAKEGKRQMIISAAVQLFSQKGYHQTKMEEIALAAGIGKGTIYEYFTSKLQLLQEIMEQSFHLYHRSLEAELSEGITFADKIRMLVEGHFRFCQQNKDLTRFLFWDTEVIDEELVDWAVRKRRDKEQQLQQMISAAIISGEIRNINAYYLTVILSGVLSAIWVPVVMDGWEVDASQAAVQITDILMRGMKA